MTGTEYDRGTFEAISAPPQAVASALPAHLASVLGAGDPSISMAGRELAEVNLASIAAHLGGGYSVDSEQTLRAFNKGFGSVHFTGAMEQAGRTLITKTYSADPTGRRIVKPLPVSDFKPSPLTQIDYSDFKAKQENGERPLLVATGSDFLPGSMQHYSAAVCVRRWDVINNDTWLLDELFSGVGHIMRRNEDGEIFGKLEANPTLPEMDSRGGEDRPWFTAADGNLIERDPTPTTEALNAAVKALRTQASPDGRAENLAPRFIVTGADHEAGFRALLSDSRWSDVDLIVSTEIDPARWYLLADPERRAAIGLRYVGLPGGEVQTWVMGSAKVNPEQFDGIGFTADQDLDATPISRRGIVRVQAA